MTSGRKIFRLRRGTGVPLNDKKGDNLTVVSFFLTYFSYLVISSYVNYTRWFNWRQRYKQI